MRILEKAGAPAEDSVWRNIRRTSTGYGQSSIQGLVSGQGSVGGGSSAIAGHGGRRVRFGRLLLAACALCRRLRILWQLLRSGGWHLVLVHIGLCDIQVAAYVSGLGRLILNNSI